MDTPGILDHPLEDRNTIEMLSITALAHLRTCIMYFLDLSEQCGYSILAQSKLFHSIKPLFANKPLVLVINKIDARRMEDLTEEERVIVDGMITPETTVVQMSCYNEDGVMLARNTACDKLLAARVEGKMRGGKINDILHRIHVAQPESRDELTRPAFIPESVRNRMRMGAEDEDEERKLERDIEAENGGAGVYNINLKSRCGDGVSLCRTNERVSHPTPTEKYLLSDDSWKQDVIPEIMDGHNVADFIDPEIAETLDALEREEEEMVAKGTYKSDDEEMDEDSLRLRKLATKILEKKKIILQAHHLVRSKQGAKLPMKVKSKSTVPSSMVCKLSSIGIDTTKLEQAHDDQRTGRKRARSVAEDVHRSSASVAAAAALARSKSKSKVRMGSALAAATPVGGSARSASRAARDRSVAGLRNVKQKLETEKIRNKAQRPANMHAKKGEADRAVMTKMPKHLFSGKRGNGTSDRR